MTEIKKKNIAVMVFGTFDGIHDGHRYFLNEAKKFGDKLIVTVAKDNTVKNLKGHFPDRPLPNRIRDLESENLADEVLAGDQEIGKWQIIERINPQIICIGYDQKDLEEALKKAIREKGLSCKIEIIKPFKGDLLHSSILKTRKTNKNESKD